jgi:hypothetical protein
MISPPLLSSVNYQYFRSLFRWRNMSTFRVGDLYKVDGFTNYNYLIDVNKIFSTAPSGDPVDRTCDIIGPLNFKIFRPWRVPTKFQSIDQVFESRVEFYLAQKKQIDLFWSGGTDSTSMVVAFLTHCSDLDQLRLVYSPHSLYENRDFFKFVTKAFPNLQTIDISGDVYLQTTFDNLIVTGHGGDEFTASLDQSFFDRVGSQTLTQNWRDFFLKESCDQNLIDFCEKYFAKSGREINTVLEARWWFYAATKSQVFGSRDLDFLLNQPDISLCQYSSFFDCYEFEDYMWHNIDLIVEPGAQYKSYKKFLRKYVFDFYNNIDYLENNTKQNSVQLGYYRSKKTELLDIRWICMLEDATVISTPNLPLFSKKEFDNKYGTTLDYLFNQPD